MYLTVTLNTTLDFKYWAMGKISKHSKKMLFCKIINSEYDNGRWRF